MLCRLRIVGEPTPESSSSCEEWKAPAPAERMTSRVALAGAGLVVAGFEAEAFGSELPRNCLSAGGNRIFVTRALVRTFRFGRFLG